MSSKPQARSRGPQSCKRGGTKSGSTQTLHPGLILAEILDDTPRAVAAKWFGMTEEEVSALLAGEAPMTVQTAQAAGTIFGTGSAPWLEMIRAWEESQTPERTAGEG